MMKPFHLTVNKVIRSVVLMCLGGLLPSASLAQTIVWTDEVAGRIQRKDVIGGDVATIVQFPSPQAAYHIQYDPIDAKLYYLFFAGGTSVTFQRANLDGSHREDIPTPNVGIFALNVELRKLYWSACTVMHRSELDGTGVESHTYQDGCFLPLLALGDDLYLGSSGGLPKGIWRADADGSNEQLMHTSGAPTDAAYDPVENKLYVAAFDKIVRLNPDGSGFEVVLNLQNDVQQVEVDYRGRKLYWVDRDAQAISRIQRSNLDGSNVEDFVSNVGDPIAGIGGLAIVYNSTPIPTLPGSRLVTLAVLLLGAGVVVLKMRVRAAQ